MLPPGAFLQATSAGEAMLAQLVVGYCQDARAAADLFCGLGPFALRLAERARITALDSERGSRAAIATRSEEKEHDAMRMQEIDIHDYARQLFEARGDKAVVEAAQKARSLEEQGQREEAETWRHVEAALKLMRGPHAS